MPEEAMAAAAALGPMVDHLVNLATGKQRTPVAGMARLSALLAL